MAWIDGPFSRRYAVYIAGLSPIIGAEIRRAKPVVIVSRDEMKRYFESVVVCPLTFRLHPRWWGRACRGGAQG